MDRRLVIIVRADPVICGHSVEARNLAEAAGSLGFSEVVILTWPIEALERAGLPLKPSEGVPPYSSFIRVERPEPIGDYRVPDGRFAAGLKGRLIELLGDGRETVVLSLYLMPHANIAVEAIAAARAAGLPVRAQCVAEAVGSDITHVVRSCIANGNYGPALYILSNFLAHDLCLAVSSYTRALVVDAARAVDAHCGTRFAERCESEVQVSYPAIDTLALQSVDPIEAKATTHSLGLKPDRFALFLSRVTRAKGVFDLVAGYRQSRCYGQFPLVIAGAGPALEELRLELQGDPWVRVLGAVDDATKNSLMLTCGAYVLPSKPQPEFTETFGIALAEKMLIGGHGPVLTTETGGIPEAVGDTALTVEAGRPSSIARELDRALLEMSDLERARLSQRAQAYARTFDRRNVLQRMLEKLPPVARSPQAQAS